MVPDTKKPAKDFAQAYMALNASDKQDAEIVTNPDGTRTEIMRDPTGRVNGYITRDDYCIKEEGQLETSGGPVYMIFYNKDGIKLSDEQLSPAQLHKKKMAEENKFVEEWHVTGYFSPSGNVHFHTFKRADKAVYDQHGVPQFPHEHRDPRINYPIDDVILGPDIF